MENVLKKCKTCGNEIPKYKTTSWKEYNKRKYCSNSCCNSDPERREKINKKQEEIYKNNRVVLNCVVCGKEFRAQKSKIEGRQRYSTCSNPECRKKHHQEIASLGFHAAKDSLLEARKHRAENERVTMKCGCGCGKIITTKKSNVGINGRVFYNREHYEKWFRGENCTFWQGGEIDYYGPNWTIQRARARKRDKVCKICGISPEKLGKQLDVHHIEPFRRFENYKDANKLSNLISLCNSCHMNVHGLLNFKDVTGKQALAITKGRNFGYKSWFKPLFELY